MKTFTISKRMVNRKKHTVGFVLNGNQKVTRNRAVQMARRSQIGGVIVVSSSQGDYLKSTTNRNLYSLPTIFA